MKRLIVLALSLIPTFSLAHECDKFLSEGWPSDEGYACRISPEELAALKLHRLEVCVGSVPYLDGKRYAHAELKWIPLSQYNNPFQKADGFDNKFFESYYSSLAFMGYGLHEDSRGLHLQVLREGSTLTHTNDFLTQLQLNKENGNAHLMIQFRKPALIFKNEWQRSWDLRLQCQRIL